MAIHNIVIIFVFLMQMNLIVSVFHNKDGDTPLHIAAELGYDEVVTLLLKHGADQTLTDKVSTIALYCFS